MEKICMQLDSEAFIFQLFHDGSFRLLPPIKWMLELESLKEQNLVSSTQCKVVIEEWKKWAYAIFASRFSEFVNAAKQRSFSSSVNINQIQKP